MKSLIGIGLVLLAISGGQLIAHSLDHAIDAPRARFDAAADAHIEQLRQQERERAELERQLVQILGLTTGH